jgi:hypothetical protein
MPRCDLTKDSTVNTVLVYGPPLTGKSTLVSLLAEKFKLIWVDCEKGSAVLYKLPIEWQQRIDLYKLPDTRSFPIATETVRKMVKGNVKICTKHGKVGCGLCIKDKSEITEVDITKIGGDTIVVFDSATQLVNSSIAHITKGQDDDYKEDWDDWGRLGKLMDKFFSQIQNGNFNCVVISHELEAEFLGKTKKIVPVGGTGNFSRNVAKYFDHVVYVTKKNKKHVAYSGTDYLSNVVTGSRSDFRIEDMEVPSLLPIFGDPSNDVQREDSPAKVANAPEPVKEEKNSVSETQEKVTTKTDTGRGKDKLAEMLAKKRGNA